MHCEQEELKKLFPSSVPFLRLLRRPNEVSSPAPVLELKFGAAHDCLSKFNEGQMTGF